MLNVREIAEASLKANDAQNLIDRIEGLIMLESDRGMFEMVYEFTENEKPMAGLLERYFEKSGFSAWYTSFDGKFKIDWSKTAAKILLKKEDVSDEV